jgi:hypothetical protein
MDGHLKGRILDVDFDTNTCTGESERILGEIFKAAEQLESCLVFLDEIDSLATSRRQAPSLRENPKPRYWTSSCGKEEANPEIIKRQFSN